MLPVSLDLPFLIQLSLRISLSVFIEQHITCSWDTDIPYKSRIYRGRDRMVVGFTATYAISAYHH